MPTKRIVLIDDCQPALVMDGHDARIELSEETPRDDWNESATEEFLRTQRPGVTRIGINDTDASALFRELCGAERVTQGDEPYKPFARLRLVLEVLDRGDE